MEKIIPGGRGSNAKPSGTKNPVGWGFKLEKTLRGGGGYGYFLEPHNEGGLQYNVGCFNTPGCKWL